MTNLSEKRVKTDAMENYDACLLRMSEWTLGELAKETKEPSEG